MMVLLTVLVYKLFDKNDNEMNFMSCFTQVGC